MFDELFLVFEIECEGNVGISYVDGDYVHCFGLVFRVSAFRAFFTLLIAGSQWGVVFCIFAASYIFFILNPVLFVCYK